MKVAVVISKNTSDTTVSGITTILQPRVKADLVNYRAILALHAVL